MRITKKKGCEEYSVWNGKMYLGDISKRKHGRRFCFFPDDFLMIGDMWFYENCLRKLADFIHSLNLNNTENKK